MKAFIPLLSFFMGGPISFANEIVRSQSSQRQIPTVTSEAFSLDGEPKYKMGFSHFDYANPDAPKGGSLRSAVLMGSYSSFNTELPRCIGKAPGANQLQGSLISACADGYFQSELRDNIAMKKTIAAFTWVALLTACSTFSTANRRPSSTGVHFCTEFQNIYFISVSDAISADCASLNYFDRAIADMNSLRISTSKPFLGSIVLNEFSGWNYGKENWFAGTIEAFIKPNDPSWAKANEYIFAHEVGHLFLQAFFAEKDPMLAELTETQKRSFEYYKYLLPILELKKSDDTCKDADSICGKKIQAMAKQSLVDLNGISGDEMIADFTRRNRLKVNKFLDVISP